MDYKGQQLCEYIYYFLAIIFGSVSWIIGYIQSDFQITFYGWAIGLALSIILCIPDWPMYNRNKVIWLDEVGLEKAQSNNKKSKKNKKE